MHCSFYMQVYFKKTQRVKQMNKLLRQRHSGRNIPIIMFIVIISVVLMSAGAVLWILNIEDIVKGTWSNVLPVVFTFLCSIYALLQWHAQLLENKTLDSTHSVPTNFLPSSLKFETDESSEKILQDISPSFYQKKSTHSLYRITTLYRTNDLPQSNITNPINADQSICSIQRSYAVHIHILGSVEMYTQNYQPMRESTNKFIEHEGKCLSGEHFQEYTQQKQRERAKRKPKRQPNSRSRKPRLRS